MIDEVTMEQVLFRVSPVFYCRSLFHHCFISFIANAEMRTSQDQAA
jgi:hypothetical protein